MNTPNKTDVWFTVPCIKCGKPITITFDEDGDVEGNVIQCGVVYSDIFKTQCTPLGFYEDDHGGFRHMIC